MKRHALLFAFVAAFGIAAARGADPTEWSSRLDQAMAHAAALAADDTKAPSDWDTLLSLLDTLALRPAPFDPSFRGRQQSDRLRKVQSFAKSWQEFVARREAEPRKALEILERLLQEESRGAVVPRSFVLERISALRKVPLAPQRVYQPPPPPPDPPEGRLWWRDRLSRVSSLPELGAALEEIDTQAKRAEYERFAPANLWEFRELAALAQQPDRLKLARAVHRRDDSPILSALAGRFRAELLNLALTRALDPPKELTARPGEEFASYLERVRADAIARQDWVALTRVHEVDEFLRHGGERPTYVVFQERDLPSHPLKTFLAAEQFRQAGQVTEAAQAYLLSLGAGHPDTPVQLIGDRLRALRARDAGAVARGEDAFLRRRAMRWPQPAQLWLPWRDEAD